MHPGPSWQSAQIIVGMRELHDYAFSNLLNRDLFVDAWMNSNSFWLYETGFDFFAPYVDDRELADGTPIERQGSFQWFGYVSTDSRKRLQVQFYWTEGRSFPRFERLNQLGGTLVFRPLPQLDGSFDLAYTESAGTIRQIREAGPQPDPSGTVDPAVTFPRTGATDKPRLYILAPQQARSVSATLRATYAFTPHLTLQAYSQLFTAGIYYGPRLRAAVEPGRRTVRLDELGPAKPADKPFETTSNDEQQVGLNLNLILRWEWRTGSTFYLVYAHQSSNDVKTGVVGGPSIGRELGALSAKGVAHGDSILVKVDLLSAL